MCESESCQLLNTTNTGGTINECKCQNNLYVTINELKKLQQQVHMSSTTSTGTSTTIETNNRNGNSNSSIGGRSIPNKSIMVETNITTDTSSSHTSSTICTTVASDSPSSSPNASTIYSSCNSNSSNSSSNTPSIGVNLRVTGQCNQGGRKYMEDYFSVAYQQSENAKDLEYAFIGIYDGHGGSEAATFAKEHLMMEIINQKLFWSDSDDDVLRAIREGYIATHYAMWRDQEKWPKTSNGLPSTAGTTATIAFIRREKIYIGHVGDSGIVLGYQNEGEQFWRAKQLTVDHKPESLVERARIMRSGGKVVVKSGVPRVVWHRPRNPGFRGPIRRNTPVDEIPFLAVARSLGDLWSYNSARNEFVVSPDPDVKVIKINPKTFRCLIFGTDGLWNVVTPQQAVDNVQEKEIINERLQVQRGDNHPQDTQWTNPSKGLVEKALKTWSSKKMRADNTSVVTVILYPPGPNTDGGGMLVDSGPNALALQQPCSFGLEYREVNAEIPADDNADDDEDIELNCTSSTATAARNATYQEMAEKYLPPEAYRNFNYYGDDDDEDEEMCDASSTDAVVDPILQKYSRNVTTTWRTRFCDKTEVSQMCDDCSSNAADAWCDSWQEKAQKNYMVSANSILNTVPQPDGDDDDDNRVSDEDNEEMDEDDTNDDLSEDVLMNVDEEKEIENSIINYGQYINDNETSSTSSSAGNFMNSFAESYNTLLNEQMAQVDESSSPSSSNAAYQSLATSSMHEIMQEQQLYQQQCISEGGGYSLTKLETRREQQRFSSNSNHEGGGVQTFQIFQQHREQTAANIQPLITTTGSYYDSTSVAYNKFLQPQPSTLELNSVLQQEREEEQQVALEQLEMQRQMAGAVSAASQTTPTNRSIHRYIYQDSDNDDALAEKYLNADDVIIVDVQERRVQINEITSSIAESSTSSKHEQPDFAILIAGASQSEESAPPKASITTPTVVEEIEKTKVLTGGPELVLYAKGKRKIAATPAISTKALAQKGSRTHFPNIPNENERLTLSSHALSKTANRLLKSLVNPAITCANTSISLQQQHTADEGGTNIETRQLRSNAHMDYAKRTLRTRNSLAKDLKPKTVSATKSMQKRNVDRVATTHFLRNAGMVNFLGKKSSIKPKTPAATKTVATMTAAVLNGMKRKSGSSCRKVDDNISDSDDSDSSLNIRKSTDTPDLLTNTHAINLRSRKRSRLTSDKMDATVNAVKSKTAVTARALTQPIATDAKVVKKAPQADASKTANAAARTTDAATISISSTLPTATGTMHIAPTKIISSAPHTQRCHDPHRNVRRTRSGRDTTPVISTFSKTTRLQSTCGNTLAAPPPSPKLINAAASVAAATRARSLSKSAATGVIKSMFLKSATACSVDNTVSSSTLQVNKNHSNISLVAVPALRTPTSTASTTANVKAIATTRGRVTKRNLKRN